MCEGITIKRQAAVVVRVISRDQERRSFCPSFLAAAVVAASVADVSCNALHTALHDRA